MKSLLIATGPNFLLFLLSRIYMLPTGFTTVPADSDCRIFQTALKQKNCGACSAFAVSTYVSMHACINERKDFIPSPYRVFDCANGTCDLGIPLGRAMSVVQFGVEDLKDSAQEYGLPCELHWEHHQQTNAMRTMHIVIDDPKTIKTSLMFFGPMVGSMTHMIYRDPHTRAYNLMPNFTVSEIDALHAVVLVGWDAADNWIVQNSWGEHWGDEFGRGRIAQDALIYVFDPSIRTMSRICLGMYCVGAVGSVLATLPKNRLACGVVYLAVLVGTLLLVLNLHWRMMI